MCSIFGYFYIDMIKLNYKRKNYWGMFYCVVMTVFMLIMFGTMTAMERMILVDSCARQINN